ncbi:hypothetical protein ATEIFO6365_0008049100 [Aspergillus terreus]|uniref:Uncharacterized protein n=1 Tax=Aspergillus terreus TaxID=33178 RepID=A0A5M3ZB73_ASPTE|nr:hypothetical protein ATETN484_0010050000 [Aspergillus terreus]GFF18547.1 hypothetical protein ATEIFO6365_0008049100 [Aspergillus terreus]
MRPHLLSALCMLVTGIYAQSGNTGTDTGNTLCTGACKASAKELSCGQLGKPEASSYYSFYKESKGCYRCCVSDDNADAFDDHMHLFGDGEK